MKTKFTASITFEASDKEHALQLLSGHFALLARTVGNGMEVGMKAKWFDGTMELALEPAVPGT